MRCIQQLLKKADGSGRVAALEILFANNAVQKPDQREQDLSDLICDADQQTCRNATMDDALYDLYMRKLIDADNAVTYAQDPVSMNKKVSFDSDRNPIWQTP